MLYYIRDIANNIIGLVDSNNQLVAKYSYDAFGNVLTKEGTYATKNPIIYKDYYYEHSMGLYYLESRYYDPRIRRFISPDNIDYLEPTSFSGLNLYAYCGNYSVNYEQISISFRKSVANSSKFMGGNIGGADNRSASWWVQTIVGAIPDLYSGAQYLMSKGMHKYFAYKKNYYYMFPIVGATHKRLAINSTNFWKLSNATFKELITGNAKVSIISVIGNVAGVGAFTFATNLLFNLYENGFDFKDKDMWIDTGIDTAIGM